MKSKFLITVSVIITFAFSQDITKYREYHNKALESYFAQNKEGWLLNNQKALKILPNCATNIYYLADAYAQNNQLDSALKYLKKAVEFGYGWNSDEDENFKVLYENPEFKEIMARVDELRIPIYNSQIAFSLNEKDLIPEGFAYDPVEKCFYISSLYKCKVVKINSDGSFTDFTTEKQDGLRSVTGMKVDAKRRILWVLSEVSGQNYINSDESELGWSGVFKYDLKSGQLIQKYVIMEEGVHHLFNDIIITKSGDVFFTDSEAKKIYTIKNNKDYPKVFLENIGLGYPNGIALSKNENYIYVADSGPGIMKIDLKTKEIKYLEAPANVTTVGIDGLYIYQNSLIAVQNGFGEASRVTRFYLDKNGDRIEKQEILEMNNPKFTIPTTGAIAGDEFYYISNSQMGSFNKNHRIYSMDKLQNVLIMKIKL